MTCKQLKTFLCQPSDQNMCRMLLRGALSCLLAGSTIYIFFYFNILLTHISLFFTSSILNKHQQTGNYSMHYYKWTVQENPLVWRHASSDTYLHSHIPYRKNMLIWSRAKGEAWGPPSLKKLGSCRLCSAPVIACMLTQCWCQEIPPQMVGPPAKPGWVWDLHHNPNLYFFIYFWPWYGI